MPGFRMLFSPVLTLAMLLFYFSLLLLGPPSELGFTVAYSSSYLSQWLLQVKDTIQIHHDYFLASWKISEHERTNLVLQKKK